MRQVPERAIERVTRPLVRFLHIESASGVLLLVCTALALLAGNSSLAEPYQRFWTHELHIGIDAFGLKYPLWYWVNDGLMAIFFFVIGLEIKRELITGELRDPRRVVLPVAAAAGGVIAPVAIFLWFQYGQPAQDGWAIPMATDIAFVVGCLALLGDRVPHGLKVTMLSLAIVDDLVAVGAIAVFFTETIKLTWGLGAIAGLGVVLAMRAGEVREIWAYVLVGSIVWLCTLKSGVHPTIAGVVLGLLTPTSAWIDRSVFSNVINRARELLDREDHEVDEIEARLALNELAFASREAEAPLDRLEASLHPWVAFGIMPVFALANAAVPVSASAVSDPVSIAVAAGLFLGKPLGIFGASWLTVRLGLAKLPDGVNWIVLVGAGWLGGIGFTMALFIASLGLDGDLLNSAKAGILIGSMLSAVLGMAILLAAFRKR